MDRELFVTNDIEQEWINKIRQNREWIEQTAREADTAGKLNHRLIDWLITEGYSKLSLPEKYGGYGLSIKSVILLQETLASYDESTALSIGWHLGIVGEVFQFKLWSDDMMTEFAEAVQNGALSNRVVSEAQTGSPTRGGRPATHAVRQGEGWLLNGVKTYTSMSHRLTHYIVGAYVEEKETLCFFYVPADKEGCRIEESWDVTGMRATESHDLILDDVYVEDRYLVEAGRDKVDNPWLMHIPAVYLGIAQGARDDAAIFAHSHSPNSIEGTIADIPHIQSKLGEMELKLMTARHFLYHAADLHQSGARGLAPTFGAAKHIVVNNGIDIVDIAMRIIGGKSLEKAGIIERRHRSMRAGLHNPPMDDAVIRMLAAETQDISR
ncbi:acyl-CoA dehydrogenase [Macrococcus brunensis]|uniref:Acyl-CoA dehydrogenase n=1 Tax=Macrococcus brunensis TaxID=198483 RepID=A0A4V3BDI2_9STAP|nr:acyl-CoA dehydrogenase family protein [Macrococcus brunensis]TDL98416.1 acyl-CoA dehydrogenase [Macrococcus brunensis]